jgi:hypothetical protein
MPGREGLPASGKHVRGRNNSANGGNADSVDSSRIACGPRLRRVSGAGRQFANGAAPQVRLKIAALREVSRCFSLFQSPLLLRGINQPKVVDAGVHLRCRAGLNEIGNRYSRQQTDNRNHDHNLHQSEAILSPSHIFHSFIPSARLERLKGASHFNGRSLV